MLIYSLQFLAVAILAALLGFGHIATGAAGIACVAFVVFLFASLTLLGLQVATSKPPGPLF